MCSWISILSKNLKAGSMIFWKEMQTQLVAEQRARQLAKRSIFNTYYLCVNQQGAIEELKDKPVGSCLFRPSPQGIDQIILTYKVM